MSELALFGSMLLEDRGQDSDIDLLVSFEPAARVTFLTLARMRRELEALLGRKVDLVPKDGLKPAIRDHVLASARVLYCGESGFIKPVEFDGFRQEAGLNNFTLTPKVV